MLDFERKSDILKEKIEQGEDLCYRKKDIGLF